MRELEMQQSDTATNRAALVTPIALFADSAKKTKCLPDVDPSDVTPYAQLDHMTNHFPRLSRHRILQLHRITTPETETLPLWRHQSLGNKAP